MNITTQFSVQRSDLECIDHPHRKRFLFFQTNYRHFFGAPNEEVDIPALFLRHLQLKDQAPLQYQPENLAHAMDNYRIVDEYGALEIAKNQAVMVSSFHYGPYNLLGGILSNEGVQFSVLANGAKYFEQMKAYQIKKVLAKELKNDLVVLTDKDVINPRDFTTMIQMMHKVRQGKSMLVYADGLEGQGGYFEHSKLETVSFLDQQIYARKGTASLAYKLKMPIVFSMVEKEGDGFVVRFFPILNPKEYDERKKFVHAYCQLGYKYLENYVEEAPEYWEIFDRLHVWLPKNNKPIETPELPQGWSPPEWTSYDKDRFGIFTERGKTYLLDSETYNILTVSKGLATLLQRIQHVRGQVVSEVLPPAILRDMFQRGILIPDKVNEKLLVA